MEINQNVIGNIYNPVLSLTKFLPLLFIPLILLTLNIKSDRIIKINRNERRIMTEINQTLLITQFDESKEYLTELNSDDFTYFDRWEANSRLIDLNNNHGKLALRFSYDHSCSIESWQICFFIEVRLYDGDFSDYYVFISSFFVLNKTETLKQNRKLTFQQKNSSYNLYTYYSFDPSPEFIYDDQNEKKFNVSLFNFILNFNQEEFQKNKNFELKGNSFIDSQEVKFSGTPVKLDIDEKCWNYSFVMSILTLLQIYYSFKVFTEVASNLYASENLSLVNIVAIIIFDFYICLRHVVSFFNITNENVIPFMAPSLLTLIIFCIFDGRILFFVWHSRNQVHNRQDIKKRFLQFIIIFYLMLATFIMFSQDILKNYFLVFLIYSLIWTPQIVHNYRKGIVNINFGYVVSITLNRMFYPLYFKLCPYNFLNLEPTPTKVFCLIFVLLFQFFLIYVQKFHGARTILPLIFRKIKYNYYIQLHNIDSLNYNECIICLDSLIKYIDENEIINNDLNFRSPHLKKKIFNFFQKIAGYFKLNNKKRHMKTPCNHYFHSKCLESWIAYKLECPFCRSPLPVLE